MNLMHILLASLLIMSNGCTDMIDNSEFSDVIGKGQNYVPEKPEIIEPTLKQTNGWKIDSIDGNSLIWYHYKGGAFNSQQNVHVLELDLSDPKYKLKFVEADPRDSLSSVASKYSAIAGINGSYEADASFIKIDGAISPDCLTLEPGHLRYWKHEGAIAYNGINKAEIGYGDKESYWSSSMPNIFSGSPMLVDNYKPVGEAFVGDLTGVDLNGLPAEDYRKHQGIRHPRTVVALTENNRLLMITIDGRFSGVAEGMTAKEVTTFIDQYFKPQSALNIDGGGSTTMYIRGKQPVTDVVNYPCQDGDGVVDHWGQRTVITHILVKETDTSMFAAGSGIEGDPFIITSPEHLMNMHLADYSSGEVYFRMDADINMASIDWQPLNVVAPYDKIVNFDGNGHIINGLKCHDVSYASLFGILCGTCRNLGVVNADIVSKDAGGILAGYVGVKAPLDGMHVGLVENCFTSGTVSGTDPVGGIAANIGKPSGVVSSSILNSYSTATVVARNKKGNSRAGGVVGIVWEGGVLKNCYSAGSVTSMNAGAAGIGAYFDTPPEGCVALNQLVENKVASANLGRISAYMGGKAHSVSIKNCWAVEGMQILNAGELKTEFATGIVTYKKAYDGETKSKDFLKDMDNYIKAGWSTEYWHSILGSQGYPILKWQNERDNY